MKKLDRPFRIGKSGNGLMWFIGGLGFCGSLLAFILSFIPPSQISTGSNTVWFSVLIIGAIIVVVAPFIIYAAKKPSWKDPDTDFEPFHWEVQPQTVTAGVTANSANAARPVSASTSSASPASSATAKPASTPTSGPASAGSTTSGSAPASNPTSSGGSTTASNGSPDSGNKDAGAPKS